MYVCMYVHIYTYNGHNITKGTISRELAIRTRILGISLMAMNPQTKMVVTRRAHTAEFIGLF